MIKLRVYILWVKTGVNSREATNHGAGVSGGMEGGGDPNKEHLERENVFFKEPNKAFEEECKGVR